MARRREPVVLPFGPRRHRRRPRRFGFRLGLRVRDWRLLLLVSWRRRWPSARGCAATISRRWPTSSSGRAVSTCEAGGADVSLAMVRAGLALAYRQYSTRYAAEEAEAKHAATPACGPAPSSVRGTTGGRSGGRGRGGIT
jgi:hypothetical protein